jgi:hypothetical protein
MSKKRKGATPPPGDSEEPAPPTIHEAERDSGASGAIIRGAEIDFAAAVVRRKAGLDVVVCGPRKNENSTLAQQIEAAAVSPGVWIQEPPHPGAGPQALPHYQPETRQPEGHTFYETERRKARRSK